MHFAKKVYDTIAPKLCLLMQCRLGSCRREDGNLDGFRRMKMVVTVIWVVIGKLETKRLGREFLIYLVNPQQIWSHVQEKSKVPPCSILHCF